MNFLALPDELLLIILDYLDLKSKMNVYNTCERIRKLVCTPLLNKSYCLSLSTLATCQTLRCDYMKAVSHHIEELNLSCVPNLTKSALVPCLRRMRNLKTLNVTYTNIVIPDLIDIKPMLENLKNIHINFTFGRSKAIRIPKSVLDSCQDVFESFENVHFVGIIGNLIYNQLPLFILAKANVLNSVKFTALIVYNSPVYEFVDGNYALTFKHLSINFPDWKSTIVYNYDYFLGESYSTFNSLDMKNLEYIIILNHNFSLYKIIISEKLRDFVTNTFNIKSEYESELADVQFGRNSVFLFWNKDHVEFDKTFFDNLTLKIKDYFPNYVLCGDDDNTGICENFHSTWYYIRPYANMNPIKPKRPKRPRVAPEEFVLDYDSIFEDKETIQMRLSFKPKTNLRHVSLPAHCDYLKKITVLNIGDSYLFGNNFFSILFNCCVKLKTLNIEHSDTFSCSIPIAKSIHLSRSLRNIRLVDKRIDFQSLLLALSQCSTLENVHIVEAPPFHALNNITEDSCDQLIANCSNLYSIFIRAFISNTMRTNILRSLHRTKRIRNMSYLNVEIHNNENVATNGLSYDPFIGVFPLNTVKDP